MGLASGRTVNRYLFEFAQIKKIYVWDRCNPETGNDLLYGWHSWSYAGRSIVSRTRRYGISVLLPQSQAAWGRRSGKYSMEGRISSSAIVHSGPKPIRTPAHVLRWPILDYLERWGLQLPGAPSGTGSCRTSLSVLIRYRSNSGSICRVGNIVLLPVSRDVGSGSLRRCATGGDPVQGSARHKTSLCLERQWLGGSSFGDQAVSEGTRIQGTSRPPGRNGILEYRLWKSR